MKVDINVEDTSERRLVSRQSFVFPRNSQESKQVTRTFFRTRKMGIDTSTLAIKTPKPSIAPNGKFSTGYKNPYAKDIISMKVHFTIELSTYHRPSLIIFHFLKFKTFWSYNKSLGI